MSKFSPAFFSGARKAYSHGLLCLCLVSCLCNYTQMQTEDLFLISLEVHSNWAFWAFSHPIKIFEHRGESLHTVTHRVAFCHFVGFMYFPLAPPLISHDCLGLQFLLLPLPSNSPLPSKNQGPAVFTLSVGSWCYKWNFHHIYINSPNFWIKSGLGIGHILHMTKLKLMQIGWLFSRSMTCELWG